MVACGHCDLTCKGMGDDESRVEKDNQPHPRPVQSFVMGVAQWFKAHDPRMGGPRFRSLVPIDNL